MNVFDYLFAESKGLTKNFTENSRESITFEQLHADSLKLANYIIQKNGTGKNIVLISHNNIFFITCYLAILKSGNTCIPLNPTIEGENLLYICEQTDAKLAFVHSQVKAQFPGNFVVVNETDYKTWIDNSILNESLFPLTQNNDVAEIIFTSGSTGKPKGVMLSHGNIIANTSSIIEYLKLTTNDTMLVVMPFYYCYGLSLFHTHLKVGGKIIFNNSFVFLGSVLNDLKKYECTGFAGVPSHYQILLRKSKSFVTSEFPSLRYVTQAGGKLHKVFIQEFIDAHPKVTFFVMYGQTEATARLSHLPPKMLDTKLGSIGKGIPGVELKVVNEQWQEIAPGETGEIIAKGDNIMLGYYKDEKLTKEAIKDGWLRTNDLATIDEDGYIYIVARKMEMLKVAGKRISPKEIEEVILTMPEVIDCTIDGIDDVNLGEAIKASIVLNDEAKNSLTAEDIRKYCFSKLASYKIPQVITFESNINVSATGKKVKQNI
jgi:long-chain acyl-CoA synthetase